MNLKLRLQNKSTLVALVAAIVALVYQVLGMAGIVPKVGEDEVTGLFGLLINILVMLGIVVDPTTQGIGDSDRAKQYDMPNKPELPDDYWEGGEDDE